MTRSAEARRRPLWIVPTERHIERAGARDVTSRRRLRARLLRDARPELRPASGALLRLVTRGALLELAWGRAEDGIGLASLVTHADRALGSLREAGTSADDLRATGTERGRALASLLERVDRRLAALDACDARAPLSTVDLARGVAALARDHVDVRVAADPTLAPGRVSEYLALHRALAAHGGGLTLELLRFDAPEHPLSRLAEALEARLAEEREPFEIEWIEAAPAPPTDVVLAQGPDAAARATARAVQEAVDAGVAPDRLVVLAETHDEPTRLALRAALERAAIPCAEARGSPIDAAPEARTLLALIAMSGRRLERDGLVELLRTPGLHPGSVVGERDEAAATRRAARLATHLARLPLGVADDGALFVDALRSELADHGDPEDAWMLGATERLTSAVLALAERPTWSGLIGRVLDVSARLRLGDPSATEVAHALAAERGATALPLRSIAEGAVAVRALRDLCGELDEAARALGLADAPLSPAELAAELEEGARGFSTAMRGAASRLAAVRVCEPREAIAADTERLIVLGFSVTSFALGGGFGLLDAATEARLPPSRRPPTRREQLLTREAELAWALASCARRTLVHATVDRDGREREPAHPAVVLANAATPPRVEPASRVRPGASTLSAADDRLVAYAAGAPPPPALAPRLALEAERRAFFMAPGTPAAAYSGRIAATDALRGAFGGAAPDRPIAVTALERALACPFKAFVERVLRATLEDDRGDALTPRERGVLLHATLLAAYEALRTLPPDRPDEERLARARAAAARVALAGDAAHSPIRREAHRRVLDEALAVVATELEWREPLSFREGERAFGPRHAAPWDALSLQAEDGTTVWIEGQIDRLDATADGRRVRVVDYKTGKPSAKRIGESDLQLPLYALAVRRAFPGAAVEAVYLAVAAGGSVSLVPKREGERAIPEERLRAIAARAAGGALRVWSGDVAPQPQDGRACARCSARPICRRPAIVPEPREDDA